MPGVTLEAFEIELQNALYNLSDPMYVPEDLIFHLLGISTIEGMDGLRRKLIEEIERGFQGDAVQDTAKITFLYQVLHHRFIQSLSQERTAEILDISARHLRRKQNEAIRVLATRLWNLSQVVTGEESVQSRQEQEDQRKLMPGMAAGENTSWAEMVFKEINLLNSRSPQMITTDLARIIQKTIDMARLLHSEEDITLEIGAISPNVEVAIHPTVLRQVILYIIQQAVQTKNTEKICIHVEESNDYTILSFTISTKDTQPVIDNLDDLARILGGKAEIRRIDQCCAIDLVFSKHSKVTVLVVDDNFETVQLFRRFTMNSRFEIHHVTSGLDLLAQIQELQPKILVIDVLLPGLDGWDLLLQIRQTPETASLPVIVSSVLGDPEIARSLGANYYLPKPVNQKIFLQTLEEATGLTRHLPGAPAPSGGLLSD